MSAKTKFLILGCFIFIVLAGIFGEGLINQEVLNIKTEKDYSELEEGELKGMEGRFSKIEQADSSMREAMKLIERGKLERAKDKLLLSIQIHEEYGFPLWEPKVLLAEVYEQMGNQGAAIQEINWLIKNTRDQEKIDQLNARRLAIQEGEVSQEPLL